MAKLIYASPMSLDGFLGDNRYDWSIPSDASTAFITDIIRPIGTYLYGRRIYETMSVWEDPAFLSNLKSKTDHEFARVWQAADKIVYSKSLSTVSTKNTRLEREFDPAKIRNLKASSETDITVSGANLAAQAIRHGLVDEYHLFVVPVTIGGGLSVLPKDDSIKLELLEERRFADHWVYLRYRSAESYFEEHGKLWSFYTPNCVERESAHNFFGSGVLDAFNFSQGEIMRAAAIVSLILPFVFLSSTAQAGWLRAACNYLLANKNIKLEVAPHVDDLNRIRSLNRPSGKHTSYTINLNVTDLPKGRSNAVSTEHYSRFAAAYVQQSTDLKHGDDVVVSSRIDSGGSVQYYGSISKSVQIEDLPTAEREAVRLLRGSANDHYYVIHGRKSAKVVGPFSSELAEGSFRAESSNIVGKMLRKRDMWKA